MNILSDSLEKILEIKNKKYKLGSNFKYWVAAFFLIILVATISNAVKLEGSSNYLSQSNTINHEIGITETMLDSDDVYDMGVHYPKTGRSGIDSDITKNITGIIQGFKDEVAKNHGKYNGNRAELNIDYESYVYNKKFASVVLLVTKNEPLPGSHEEYAVCLNYDIQKERSIGLKDIFTGNYLEVLSRSVKKSFEKSHEYIPKNHDFDNFTLKNGLLTIYFDRNQVSPSYTGLSQVDIPTSTLKSVLKVYSSDSSRMYKVKIHRVIQKQPKYTLDVPKRKIDPDKPVVAITFDDGPHPEYTVKVLDMLKKNGVVATFFLIGNRVYSYDSLVLRAVKEGNELGNHTWNHSNLTKMTNIEIASQISKTRKVIFDITGLDIRLIRPTYGSYNKNVLKYSKGPIILWSVDPEDWKYKKAKTISQKVLSKVKNGDIILLHDVYKSSADAAEMIVKKLKKKGYQFVTVSEMFELKNRKLKSGMLYYKYSEQ